MAYTREKVGSFPSSGQKPVFFFIIALGILIIILFSSLSIGSAGLGFTEVVGALFKSGEIQSETEKFARSVVWHLRLPRAALGLIAGAGLALCGTVMQAVTRNPLVSPFTIGVSSASAFGASLAISLGAGLSGISTFGVVGAAFVFAMGCSILVLALSRFRGITPETLVLAGIAMSYLFASFTSVLHFFASEDKLMAMIHWTFGTLTSTRWNEVYIVAAVCLACIPVLIRFSWDLNAVILAGDEAAKSLGVHVSRVRIISLLLCALITAVIICFTGIIGFIGLVAPHISRYLIGSDNRRLLPASMITGSILVTVADTVGRVVLSPLIIPLGIVISFIGVPLFLYVLLSRKKEYWK